MLKICIVILNWNGRHDTFECLKSISKLENKGYELQVIIVDNGSTDNSVNSLRSLKESGLNFHLLELPDNAGFSKGNNIGIDYALGEGADFILILNNDTYVHRSLIINLLKYAKRYPGAGIISPKIYFAKGFEFKNKYKKSELGRVIWAAGGDVDWNNIYGTNHGVDEVDNGQFESTREIAFASGAAMFIRSNAISRVGKFDEKYYMYLEDLELSYRMWKKGWGVIYVPSAIVWHKVAQSSSVGGDLNDYFITRNRLIFGMRHARLRTKIALFRESIRLKKKGRKWQKKGVSDYYLRKYGRGSWKNIKKQNL